MAEFDGMNTTTNTPSAVGGIGSTLATGSGGFDGLDVGYKIVIIVTSIIGALGVLATLITSIHKCCKKRRQRAGNGQQPSSPEERIELNPLNADTGNRQQSSTPEERIELNTLNADTRNDGHPQPHPASAGCVDEGTVLQLVQERLQNVYKTLFIPKRPVNPSRSIAEVDELYTELQLLESIEETSDKKLTTRDEIIPVKNPYKILLDSWRYLLNPEKVKNLMIILYGGAGFGKTTLFKRIAHTWATSNQLAKFKLLFRLELKKMKTSSIIDAILDQCSPQDKLPDRNDLIRIISENQSESVFLLDGLDELQPRFLEPSEDVYCMNNVLHKQVLQESCVLVATRPHKVEDIIEGYPRSLCVEISGFTEKNTEEYIRKYFRVEEGKGHELIEIMKTKESLRQLAHIPVICQIVCHIFKFGESQLPDGLAQLYRKFTEFLAQRRCGEDWKQRLETALTVLGRVALDGLLDDRQLVLTQREFDDCASVLSDACEESGFIQQETYESVDGLTVIVTFLHRTFQEYSAAYYLANLHHTDEEEFDKRLQQIKPFNVRAMEYLLRFACGISFGSPATGLILEHVQEQYMSEQFVHEVQKITRQLLFESRSYKMADKLDRPTRAECDCQEDLLAMRYYLQCLRQPLVELEDFIVCCRSHDDLTLLKDINDLLRDNTAIRFKFDITCRSQEDLTLLRKMVRSGYIRLVAMNQFFVTYIMSEQANEEMQTLEETLEGIAEGCVGLSFRFMHVTLEINEMSHFDDDWVLGSRVRNLIGVVNLRNRTYDDVSRLVDALGVPGCDGMRYVFVYDTNLHGHLDVVAPLVPPSLEWLILHSCGLNDDDVPDLISILPARHRLMSLRVGGNAFSADGVQTLTAHLKKLSLWILALDCKGPDAEHVKQVVRRNLPKVHLC